MSAGATLERLLLPLEREQRRQKMLLLQVPPVEQVQQRPSRVRLPAPLAEARRRGPCRSRRVPQMSKQRSLVERLPSQWLLLWRRLAAEPRLSCQSLLQERKRPAGRLAKQRHLAHPAVELAQPLPRAASQQSLQRRQQACLRTAADGEASAKTWAQSQSACCRTAEDEEAAVPTAASQCPALRRKPAVSVEPEAGEPDHLERRQDALRLAAVGTATSPGQQRAKRKLTARSERRQWDGSSRSAEVARRAEG